MFDLLEGRKSVRKYSDRAVDESLLKDMIDVASRASTTGNMQLYSVVITRDEKKKEALAPAHFNQPVFKAAPVVLTFCADFNRFNRWCKQRDAEPGYDNFLSFTTAAIDAIIFAQTLCVAAESRGLGVCYLGTTTYNAAKIVEELKLPRGVVPVTTVTLGWPDDDSPRVDRLPVDSIIHTEEYSDYSSEDIDAIYAEKEAREDSIKFVEDNGKSTLAQVFTDVRYTKENNEYFSTQFIEVLKSQGYM